MTAPEGLEKFVERSHIALDAFARGDATPMKELYAHTDDATLANPWGPAVRGWARVAGRADEAATKFRDGTMHGAERVATYAAPELATILEVEHWRARLLGRAELSDFDLRVSTTFRRERDGWRIVLRHADHITTDNPEGPLRRTGP